MTANATTWDPALKQLYRDQLVHKSTYTDRPFLAMASKFEGFTGKNMPMIEVYGNPQGRSATFSEAQGNSTSSKIEDFLLDVVSNYSVAFVTGDVIDRTRSDKGAFLKALKSSIDNAMDSLADDLETSIPRSGTGSIGQVSSGSTVSATTITLEEINDVSNFEVGMTLRGTSTDGGAYDVGEEVLAGVNRSTGVLTCTSAAWNTVMTDLAASDYLVVSGDAQNGTSNAKIKMTGLDEWLPDSTPSTTLWGVTRSTDSRLYGTYHDGSAQTMEDALIDAQSKSAQQEGSPNLGIINHVKMRRLIKELGASKEYTTVNAVGPKGLVASVGFRGVFLQGDKTVIRMVAANKCPSARGYLLEQENYSVYSIGKATKFLEDDGNRILRQSSADGVEVRLVSRSNVSLKNPIGSVRVKLPS